MDYSKITNKIVSFLKKEFKKRNKEVAIIGLSGGLDSETVYSLLKKTGLTICALRLPADLMKFETAIKLPSDKKTKGNINARLRMIIQYAIAGNKNGLVVGTEDASEYWLGYFTRWGDQACDISPISGLFKTEVRELAKYLGVSKTIINKPSSPNLWKGQTAEGELGFTYKNADPILKLYCLGNLTKEKIIKLGYKKRLVEKVIERVNQTKYKREPIPTCKKFQ